MARDSFENQEAARYVPSAMAINDFCRDITIFDIISRSMIIDSKIQGSLF